MAGWLADQWFGDFTQQFGSTFKCNSSASRCERTTSRVFKDTLCTKGNVACAYVNINCIHTTAVFDLYFSFPSLHHLVQMPRVINCRRHKGRTAAVVLGQVCSTTGAKQSQLPPSNEQRNNFDSPCKPAGRGGKKEEWEGLKREPS